MKQIKFMQSRREYKAESPERTVNKIRSILLENDIFTIEKAWFKESDSLVSLGFGIPDVPIQANGKGINEKYALASACGEFVERLQNLIAISENIFSGNQKDKRVFYPDSCIFNYKGIADDRLNLLMNMFDFQSTDELDKLIGELGTLYSVPYYSILEKRAVELPSKFMFGSIGSNGMCAGNSAEEALIEGICEIYERYALQKIYKNLASPVPVISENILRQIPQWHYFEELKQHGFELYAKDCSFNLNLPVVGILAVSEGKAIFNLAAAPDFSIAVERCFTEMFQGCTLHTLKECKMNPISALDADIKGRKFSTQKRRIEYQYHNSLKSARGIVNPLLFDNSSETDIDKLNNIFKYDSLINKDTLNGLLKLATDNGYDVLIRDVAFLGFPSFHVYIPGMSEVLRVNYCDAHTMHIDIPRARDIFYRIDTASNEEITYVLNTIEKMLDLPNILDKYTVVEHLTMLSLNEKAILKDIDIENILVMLYYRVGAIDTAKRVLYDYLVDMIGKEQLSNPPDSAIPHLCLLDFLDMLEKGIALETAKEKLKEKYAPDIVEETYLPLENPYMISDYFGIPNCTDCSSCSFTPACTSCEIIRFANKIKNIICRFNFDQAGQMHKIGY